MDHLQRLMAIEDIKQLKARYFRCMDTKDWKGLAAVFSPDAVFDLRTVSSVRHPVSGEWSPPPGGDEVVFSGHEAVVGMIRNATERRITMHHGHMPEIEVTGDDTATGIWAMEDIVLNAPGEPHIHLHGYGHYHETYVRLEDGWKIRTTRITRLLMTPA